MNKKIMGIMILVVIIAILFGGGITYLCMSNIQKNKIESNSASTFSTGTDIEKVENKKETKKSSLENENNFKKSQNNTETTKKRKILNVALQGCIITESNSETGAVTYKEKCEVCGNIEPGGTSTYLSSGIMNSSFRCSKCKNLQKVQIESTLTYE